MVSDEAVKLTDVSEEIPELISEISERYGIGSPITGELVTGSVDFTVGQARTSLRPATGCWWRR